MIKKKARKWNAIVDHLENNRIKDYEYLNYDFLDKNVLVVEKKKELDWWTIYFVRAITIHGMLNSRNCN